MINQDRLFDSEVKRLRVLKQELLENAIDSLSRYKFMMFGYYAAVWVNLNAIDTQQESNPFRELVEKAREMRINLEIKPLERKE